jgi:hypothetical protein
MTPCLVYLVGFAMMLTFIFNIILALVDATAEAEAAALRQGGTAPGQLLGEVNASAADAIASQG